MDDRADEFLSQLNLSPDKLRSLCHGVLNEIHRGLTMHRKDPSRWRPSESDLMCLDCCFSALPTGNERGCFYALDFGGTNIRVVRAQMDGINEPTFEQEVRSLRETGVSQDLPKGVLDKKATATMLFDAVADIVHEYMKSKGDLKSPTPFPLGFTFSFGITQPAIDKAFLYQWAKDFETGMNTDDPVIGQDVCALMSAAFQRKGVPVRLVATLNDTTGTMIAAAMKKPKDWPQCTVGMIIGTGINGCYYEPKAAEYGYNGNVINTECGGFKQDLPFTSVDLENDLESQNQGSQLFEKMISGHYLAETIRKSLLQILRDQAPPTMWKPCSLRSVDSARIYADEGPCDSVAKANWGPDLNPAFFKIVKQTVDAVYNRSAACAAVLVASLAKKTGRLTPGMSGVTVGVDGSVYTKNPKYQAALRRNLEIILTKDIADLIFIQVSDDGSGKGAACLAATLTQSHSPLH